jgi:hypothetical protein
MGRVKVYTSEEAKTKQKEQIKKANQKYREQRKEFKNKVFNEQLRVVKILNKTIVDDKEFVNDLLSKVEAKVGPVFTAVTKKPKVVKDPNAPKKPRAPKDPNAPKKPRAPK